MAYCYWTTTTTSSEAKANPSVRVLSCAGARETAFADSDDDVGDRELALVPLAITGDIPGMEIEHPMAVVILGGLLTSTLLNLFVVPALYLRLGARSCPSLR